MFKKEQMMTKYATCVFLIFFETKLFSKNISVGTGIIVQIIATTYGSIFIIQYCKNHFLSD